MNPNLIGFDANRMIYAKGKADVPLTSIELILLRDQGTHHHGRDMANVVANQILLL